MATQSFMKSFTVSKRNAGKLARVLNSNKKINIERNFDVNNVKKENVRIFLNMER